MIVLLTDMSIFYTINVICGVTGATRDLGSGLTRFCLRHRNLEGKMRTLCRLVLNNDDNDSDSFIIIIIISI